MDLPPDLRSACSELLPAPIDRMERVGGGDINEARRLHSADRSFFLKFNRGEQAAAMLHTEARGLDLLRQAGPVRLPKVIGQGSRGPYAFLLLEWIDAGSPAPEGWETFGRELAELHAHPQPYFGLDHDNFIGSLPQSNARHEAFPDFFRAERLEPQLERALASGRLHADDRRRFEALFDQLPDRIPPEAPALIHGDLWSGNYLFDTEGKAVIIDPAVAFAHREMDLAMSKLFGGFAPAFYAAYDEAYPLEPGWEDRMDLYQLYYLLVHVNLFGGGYAGSVRSILRRLLGSRWR